MATINPNQEYDIIHTLTFAEASGTCPIRLHRGSSSAISGTVYYRAGTSGDWTSLSVSGTDTTFPVTSTTMQIAHNWNKSGNDYMTPSFRDATNITSIAISQKSFLTGAMGNYFMYAYAFRCSSLTSLDIPDVSGLTRVGNNFMYNYAYGCSSLTSLDVPDTSSLTSVGDSFMRSYAYGCSSLTSLDVPDTSGLTSVGDSFMRYYARDCSSLTKLVLPAVGWFEDNNVDWSVPSDRLGVLKGNVLHSGDLNSWKALTAEGKTLYTNYIRDPELVYYEEAPVPITVTTLPVTDITTSSARLRGEVEIGGGSPPFWLDFGEILEGNVRIGGATGIPGASSSDIADIPSDLFPLYYDGWHEFYDYEPPINDTFPMLAIQYDTETQKYVHHAFISYNSDGSTVENRLFEYGNSYHNYRIIIGHPFLLTQTVGVKGEFILRRGGATGEILYKQYYDVTVGEDMSCYLTTAMVGYFGKDDDGIELNSMRALRSHSGHKYQDVLDEYHRVSPQIIQGIEQSGQQEYYYGMIKDVVENTATLVANEEWQQAEQAYLNLYNWLKNEFQISKTDIEVIPAPMHYEIDEGKIFTLEGEELYSAYFQYRKKGASTWLETAKQTVTVDGSQTFDAIVENLDDNTEYEYRAVTDYGGESYYGEILTFKTKLFTEYCEYNADTFRQIVVEQEYGADSFRTVLREDSYSADTKRATIKEYTFTADTLRKLKKSYEYQADMLRQVVKDYAYQADVLRRIAEEAQYQADMVRQIAIGQEFEADTLRQIVIQQEFTADAIRQVIQSQGYNADTKRQVLKTYEHNTDTLRKVLAEQSFSGDTKRHIVQDALFNADTIRGIIKGYDYTADSLRKVLRAYKYPADIKRRIIRADAYNADILRRIVKEYEYSADTMRFVVELGIYVGDTYRVVRADQVYGADALRQAIADQVYNADALRQAIADQVYNADALRQAIKEYEFIADTFRRIERPYIRLKVTLSVQEREVGLSLQERKPSLSI